KRSTAKKAAEPVAVDAFAQTVPDSFIEQFIDSPGAFIVPTDEARAAAMDVVSRTYDSANMAEKYGLFDDWNAVLNSGFDPSVQLWELINVRNEPVLKSSLDVMKELSQLIDSVASDESEDEDDSDDAMDVSDDQQVVASDAESSESEESDGQDSEAEISEEQSADDGSDVKDSDDEDTSEEESEEESTAKPSVVDDEFFSLAEMESFVDKVEEEEMRDRAILAGEYPKRSEDDDDESSDDDDDESIDLFQDHGALEDEDDDEDGDGSDDGEKRADEMMYADFFKPPKSLKRDQTKEVSKKRFKRVKFDVGTAGSEDEDDDDDEDEESDAGSSEANEPTNLFDDDDESNAVASDGKSEFERRQEKLQGLISKLEDEAVAEKHWAMIGEVGSNVRPKNSLLAEDLDFDHMQKPVPVVTQDATASLEDVIKRRILNEEWNDVERKKDIQAKPFRPSEFIALDDKKSKKSLAEEYEAEYMAQKTGDDFVPENDAKLAEKHQDINSQMRNLFTQLDSLSHFHFAPKPAA
ncbi:U3 snoRNP protein, partial [Coemansia sp. RSA 2708]